MNRLITKFVLCLGMALTLGACSTWPQLTAEKPQPLAERVDRMNQGPFP
jgi:starvation-inducible outer membrane lipoprotein